MLTLIFIFIASIFNAICDTLKDHFQSSIFSNLNPNWWDPAVTANTMGNFLGIVRLDAWHLSKYGWMLSWVAAVGITILYPITIWEVVCMPFVWSLGFELFYSYIFKLNK